MRHIRNLAWFAVGVFIAFVWLVPQAYAQTVDPAFNRMINGIIQNAPGVTTTAIPSGVTTVGTGTSNITTVSGLRIPIPETASANVGRAAIAKAGARLASKAIPIAGAAFTAWQIYDAYQDSGFHLCSAADGFFCQSDLTGLYPQTHYCYAGGSTNPNGTNCGADPGPLCSSWNSKYQWKQTSNGDFQCIASNGGGWGFPTRYTVCPANMTLVAGMCSPSPTIPTRPYTEAELEEAFKQKMIDDPEFAKRYYDAIRADNVRHGVLDNSYVLPPDSPLTIYAPPVTTPETTTKTRTIPLSDGTVDTETTKEKVTVTPTQTGTTVGDKAVTYPTTKTETTTVTNNTTNTTTTTTTVTNEAPQNTQPSKEPEDPCIANPNRAGCALLGEPPAAQDIPKQDVPITVTPIPFASVASCPAPITFEMYGSRSITYDATCDVMQIMRPIFLAMGAAACAWIFMGALKV